MKLTRLIALPFAMLADGLTLGEGGVTRQLFNAESEDRFVEALKAAAEIAKHSKEQ